MDKLEVCEIEKSKARLNFNSTEVKMVGEKTVGDKISMMIEGKICSQRTPYDKKVKGIDMEMEIDNMKIIGSRRE